MEKRQIHVIINLCFPEDRWGAWMCRAVTQSESSQWREKKLKSFSTVEAGCSTNLVKSFFRGKWYQGIRPAPAQQDFLCSGQCQAWSRWEVELPLQIEGVSESLRDFQLIYLWSRGKKVIWSKSSGEEDLEIQLQLATAKVGLVAWSTSEGKLGKSPFQIWNKWPYLSTVVCPLWGWLESDKKHRGEGVKLRIPVCWQCRQRGKHSKRHSFGGAAIGLGIELLQRYDLHLENKKCTCLWLSHLHLCCATMESPLTTLWTLLQHLTSPIFEAAGSRTAKGNQGAFFWARCTPDISCLFIWLLKAPAYTCNAVEKLSFAPCEFDF